MTAAAIITAIAALSAVGFWIFFLYRRLALIPELRVEIKKVADRRDELARELAIERHKGAEATARAEKLSSQLARLAAEQKESTDARIQEDPGDGGVQLRIADELLGRRWPSDSAAGTNGDRPRDG